MRNTKQNCQSGFTLRRTFVNTKNLVKVQPQRGFTLIELLIIFGIMAIIGGVTSDLLMGIFKGANKASVMNEIKQNGNYALNFMDRTIRNASSIQLSDSDKIVIQNQENASCIRFWMHTPAPLPNVKNGFISYTTANYCTVSAIDNTLDESTTFPTEGGSLINTDLVSGVSLTNGNIAVDSFPGKPSTVSVGFTLSQGEKASSRNDYTAAEIFKTTISLRTY